MKRDCSTCICKEGSCYPSTTIFDKDKTCKSYDPDYEGYIAELEHKLEQTEKDLADYQFNYPTIKELEKENAELQDKLKNLASVAEVRLANWQKYEKENAELREQLNKVCEFKGCMQLTKAKEILKQLANIEYAVNIPKDKIISLRVKAEQFIKDSEEK